VPKLLPTPTSNNATSGQLATVTAGNAQACMQASNQPRKRGRPRKDASLSNNPPKKEAGPRETGMDLAMLRVQETRRVLLRLSQCKMEDLPGNRTVPLFAIH
jgi:hypothetical protein